MKQENKPSNINDIVLTLEELKQGLSQAAKIMANVDVTTLQQILGEREQEKNLINYNPDTFIRFKQYVHGALTVSKQNEQRRGLIKADKLKAKKEREGWDFVQKAINDFIKFNK